MDEREIVNFRDDLIKISFIEGEIYKVLVSWPTIVGAIGYNVYGSPHVLRANKLNDTLLTTNQYVVDLPIVPNDTQWFFWVFWVDNQGHETLIQEDPATLLSQENPFAEEHNPLTEMSDYYLPNEMMQYYASEIRTRHKAILENDGEDFTVYIKRWTGLPCVCVPGNETALGSDPDLNMDSDYDGAHRCDKCFGTGILGGYFPALSIKVRYGELPSRIIQIEPKGISLGHNFNSWTLWVPILHDFDLLVRKRTGERFLVKTPKMSMWRGVPLHQVFNAEALSVGDFRNTVTNDKIQAALELSDTFDVARFNNSIWQ